MRRSVLFASAVAMMLAVGAEAKSPKTAPGGLSPENIEKIKSAYKGTPSDKALHNALAGTDIDVLALDAEPRAQQRHHQPAFIGPLLALHRTQRAARTDDGRAQPAHA